MGDPIRLPLPRSLRGFAHEAIEDALLEFPDRVQHRYRRLLVEESEEGVITGHALPAARALERLLAEDSRAAAP